VQSDLDIQILREIFAVLGSEADGDLTLMQSLIELELVISAFVLHARGAWAHLMRQERRHGLLALIAEVLRLAQVVL